MRAQITEPTLISRSAPAGTGSQVRTAVGTASPQGNGLGLHVWSPIEAHSADGQWATALHRRNPQRTCATAPMAGRHAARTLSETTRRHA
jgi:hypothetical protein